MKNKIKQPLRSQVYDCDVCKRRFNWPDYKTLETSKCVCGSQTYHIVPQPNAALEHWHCSDCNTDFYWDNNCDFDDVHCMNLECESSAVEFVTSKLTAIEGIKHTSLPWINDRGTITTEGGHGGLVQEIVECHLYEQARNKLSGTERDENAAFIVHACNCHRELLEALDELLAECNSEGYIGQLLPSLQETFGMQLAKVAIAKAEKGLDYE